MYARKEEHCQSTINTKLESAFIIPYIFLFRSFSLSHFLTVFYQKIIKICCHVRYVGASIQDHNEHSIQVLGKQSPLNMCYSKVQMQSYMTFLMTLKKIQNNFVCIAYSHVWATIACQVKVPCVVGCSLVFCVCHVSFEINRISIWHKPKSTKSVRIVQCGCGWALVQLSPPGLSTEIVVVLMLHLISIGIKSNNSLPSRLLRIVQRQIYVNNDGTGSGHPLFLWFLCFVRYSKQKWSSRNQMLLTCGKYNEQKQFTKLWCHLNNLRLDMWAWKIFSLLSNCSAYMFSHGLSNWKQIWTGFDQAAK